MKKTPIIVIIIGCLLLLANISVAAGTVVDRLDLTKKEIEMPIDTTASLVEEDGDVAPQESENLVTNEEETEHFIVQPGNLININSKSVVLTLANAGGPYSGETGETITFDGSHCFVIPGSFYEWDFRDGTIGYGLHPTHGYSSPGIYHVILTVTKPNGDTYQDIAPVYIDQEGDHLLPYGKCFYEGEVGEEIIFDGSQSISTDSNSPITEWVWHFGDGAVEYGEQVTHTYEKEKVYLVTLEVRDDNGNMRQDVLHADIGKDYTSLKDFFVNTDGTIADVLEWLLEDDSLIKGIILCDLFYVKMYTKYVYDDGVQPVEIEKTRDIDGFFDFPLELDVNNDGDNDVRVNKFELLKPCAPSQSPFNDFAWFSFETTISDIDIISNDITIDVDFTICLQFSLQLLEEFLGLQEPIVQIGYHSAVGEEKSDNFEVTHIFRPYFLFKLLAGSSQPQGQQSVTSYPIQQSSPSPQPYTNPTPIYAPNNMQQSSVVSMPSLPKSSPVSAGIASPQVEIEQTQAQPVQPNPNPEESWELITENGVRIGNSDTDHFSLLVSFSNVIGTTRTTFAAAFDSFSRTTLMHRKSEEIRDVDIKGSDDSTLTLSVTRENQHGSAKLGLLINPLQSMGFHLDINKLANNARHIGFNIDNPPETLVLFTENEDNQGGQDSKYFYLKNLPTRIDFEWLPRLDDGYITLTKDYASDELVVGICDDLEDPYVNLYMSNLPTETSLSWQITSTHPRSFLFESDTDGLTLNAELKDEQGQSIDFHATSNIDFDMKFSWDLSTGYFELQRSMKNIDFDFSLLKEKSSLDVTGNFEGGPDEGFVLNFGDLQHGSIEFSNDIAFDVNINAENQETETSLNTDLAFTAGGDVDITWNEDMNFAVDLTSSVGLSNFELRRNENYVTADQITLSAGGRFGLIYKEGAQLSLGGTTGAIISNFNAEIGDWSGSISSATVGGGFDITLKPTEKYYELDSDSSFIIEGFDINYDGPGETYDIDFDINYFNKSSGGNIWFDFSTPTPKFNLDSEDIITLNNLHLMVGSYSSSAIDFTISSFNVNNDGSIYGEWENDYLFVDADVDFSWDMAIQTLNYGNWEINGELEGDASITLNEWEPGQSGDITFSINDDIYHSFQIIHDELTLDFGALDFDQGTITFDWQREQAPNNGYININNSGVTGSFNLLKITHDDQQNPFELELGNISVSSGSIYMDWSRQTNQKMLYIDNSLTVNMELIKFTWDDKTISLGDLSLNPGEFKFTWDTINKKVTLNNGITGLGPICSYEDSEQKLSVDLLNVQDDYSKTMTLRWYKDDDDKISGIYVDTDEVNFVDWITFEVVKFDAAGDSGRKIAFGGLEADEFEIKRNTEGDLNIAGKLHIANHLTFSKLVNDDWKDFEMSWDINLDGLGNVEFSTDPGFNENLDVSAKFAGVDIVTTFDLPQYLKFEWDVNLDGNGHVFIDTDGQEVYEIGFSISKDAYGYSPKWGLFIGAIGLIADDYHISWDSTPPPGQWPITTSGYIEPGCINDIMVAWNGQWYDLWNGQGQPV